MMLSRFIGGLWQADERHGPLPPLLFALTVVTGLVDAVSYLKLGHVFVANMTGNVVFLGFAVADPADFSIPASLTAVAAFLFGATIGGRLARGALHRGRHLTIAVFLEILLVGGAFVLSTSILDPDGTIQRYGLIALLALAMGVQNATARRLSVPDLTTTVLTLTLTGVAADSALGDGSSHAHQRRLLAVAAMFLGAAVGAVMLFFLGVSAVLLLTAVLLILIGLGAARHRASIEPWTTATGAPPQVSPKF